MPSISKTNKTVALITLGCAKNEVDSEIMVNRLVAAGYAETVDPERADVVIVNTCSFIQAATEESIDAILEVAGYESVKTGKSRLVVAGCMPSRYGDDLAAELDEASEFVPCADEASIVDVVDRLCGVERVAADLRPIEVARGSHGAPSAYVKISDGCDRFCSYCTIPFIRGRYRSFPEDDIRREVSELVESGTREIVLIAQDTGRWGSDLDQRSSLSELLCHLAEEFEDTWFRVMYVQPEGVTDDLVEAVRTHDNICSYFDIPFQHCDPDVLSRMNRKGSAGEFLELIGSIRERIPDVTLRTTLIAGFPGETDEQFEGLCEFVEDANLDYVGVFAYSREEGTRAYGLDGQIDEDEKLYRTQTIRDLADTLSANRLEERIGACADVLVCGMEEDGQLFGRGKFQAPDVDGVVYVDGGSIGDVVRVRIEDTLMYEMEGTVIS